MNNWFNVPTAQTTIFVLFLGAGVFFDGAFSLWVSLTLFAEAPRSSPRTFSAEIILPVNVIAVVSVGIMPKQIYQWIR